MSFHRSRNFLFLLLIVFLLVAAAVLFLRSSAKNRDTTIEDYFKPGVDHNTIYFRVTDSQGQVSYVHDSGVNPGKAAQDGEFKLNVVKQEYNNGEQRHLQMPVKVEYGQQIANLKHVYNIGPDRVKDKNSYYVLTINIDGNRFS